MPPNAINSAKNVLEVETLSIHDHEENGAAPKSNICSKTTRGLFWLALLLAFVSIVLALTSIMYRGIRYIKYVEFLGNKVSRMEGLEATLPSKSEINSLKRDVSKALAMGSLDSAENWLASQKAKTKKSVPARLIPNLVPFEKSTFNITSNSEIRYGILKKKSERKKTIKYYPPTEKNRVKVSPAELKKNTDNLYNKPLQLEIKKQPDNEEEIPGYSGANYPHCDLYSQAVFIRCSRHIENACVTGRWHECQSCDSNPKGPCDAHGSFYVSDADPYMKYLFSWYNEFNSAFVDMTYEFAKKCFESKNKSVCEHNQVQIIDIKSEKNKIVYLPSFLRPYACRKSELKENKDYDSLNCEIYHREDMKKLRWSYSGGILKTFDSFPECEDVESNFTSVCRFGNVLICSRNPDILCPSCTEFNQKGCVYGLHSHYLAKEEIKLSAIDLCRGFINDEGEKKN